MSVALSTALAFIGCHVLLSAKRPGQSGKCTAWDLSVWVFGCLLIFASGVIAGAS